MPELSFIVRPLLQWYAQNARPLPWRRDREPYHVWVSEIMLQQTRAEAVREPYLRFLAALPTLEALAGCEEERLMKLWEGMGYYRRARNLQLAAKKISEEYNGEFPGEYEQILRLPGIGPYTAGAIASICFGEPVPAIDGNVLRIMARLTDCAQSVDDPAVRRAFGRTLSAVYPKNAAGDFTQALMELGACVCTPRSPRCALCPIQSHCLARAAGSATGLPVRKEKKARRLEDITVFLLQSEGRTALRQRPDAGLLAGLWELPNVEGSLSAQEALDQARAWGLDPLCAARTLHRTHIFTHVEWRMTCHVLPCARPETGPAGFIWAPESETEGRYALPSAFKPFLTL